MELDSLTLANDELNAELTELEKKVDCYASPSLHSIHSEDLISITKIYELAEEEIKLKNSIKELEDKEFSFREQLNMLLSSREFQNISGCKMMVQRIKELERNENRMHCALQIHKHNMHKLKKKFVKKEQEVKADVTYAEGKIEMEKPVQGKQQAKTISSKGLRVTAKDTAQSCICGTLSEDDFENKPKQMTTDRHFKHSKRHISHPPCKTCALPVSSFRKPVQHSCCVALPVPVSMKPCSCDDVVDALFEKPPKLKTPCSKNLPCEPPPCATLGTSVRRLPKMSDCICARKTKCPSKLNDMPCKCNTSTSRVPGKEHQPTVSKASKSCVCSDDTDSSDDEFCECCSSSEDSNTLVQP